MINQYDSFEYGKFGTSQTDIQNLKNIISLCFPSSNLGDIDLSNQNLVNLTNLKTNLLKIREYLNTDCNNFKETCVKFNRSEEEKLNTIAKNQHVVLENKNNNVYNPNQNVQPFSGLQVNAIYHHNNMNYHGTAPQNQSKKMNKQKTQQPPRQNTNRGSERTVRNNDKQSEIWVRSEKMFSNFNKDVIRSLFKTSLEKAESISHEPIKTCSTGQHWSEALMLNIQKNSKENKEKVLLPPGPPPAETDISEFWNNRKTRFPIEDMQKQNASVLHHLLGALVESEPIEKHLDDNAKKFLPINVLAPKLQFHSYLRFEFDSRLNFELQSIGLIKQSGSSLVNEDIFEPEIKRNKEEVINLIATLNMQMSNIFDDIDNMQRIHDRRADEQECYRELMKEVSKDVSKKKKK